MGQGHNLGNQPDGVRRTDKGESAHRSSSFLCRVLELKAGYPKETLEKSHNAIVRCETGGEDWQSRIQASCAADDD
jgi:hypothetical protein